MATAAKALWRELHGNDTDVEALGTVGVLYGVGLGRCSLQFTARI
jgi:hypothetical protein